MSRSGNGEASRCPRRPTATEDSASASLPAVLLVAARRPRVPADAQRRLRAGRRPHPSRLGGGSGHAAAARCGRLRDPARDPTVALPRREGRPGALTSARQTRRGPGAWLPALAVMLMLLLCSAALAGP